MFIRTESSATGAGDCVAIWSVSLTRLRVEIDEDYTYQLQKMSSIIGSAADRHVAERAVSLEGGSANALNIEHAMYINVGRPIWTS
jgi:hypothetical protein